MGIDTRIKANMRIAAGDTRIQGVQGYRGHGGYIEIPTEISSQFAKI